jgi:hypothetical protein
LSKILGFFFEKTIGKTALWGVLLAGLFGWWQLDRAGQRNIAVAGERAAAAVQQTEAVNAELESADKVRTDAERAARGERVRNVRPDPYHDSRAPAPGR